MLAITFPSGHTHSLSSSIQIQIISLIEQRQLNWHQSLFSISAQSWSVSSTCTVHKVQVCRTDDDDPVSSWSVLRGIHQPGSHLCYLCVGTGAARPVSALIFKSCGHRCAGGLTEGEVHPAWIRGNTSPLLFLSLPRKLDPVCFLWSEPLITFMSWPLPEWAERQRLVGEGSQKQTPYTHTHTHTHTYIYTVTHTRPQPGLSARRPTSAQLCHTIHLLISALPPLTAAEPSEQTWRPQTFLPPLPSSRPSEDAEGIPHQYPHRFTASPESDGTYSSLPRLPQSQSVSRAEPSWAERGDRERRRRRGKKKWHILNRWKSSRCFRVHRECGRAPVPASGVIAAI